MQRGDASSRSGLSEGRRGGGEEREGEEQKQRRGDKEKENIKCPLLRGNEQQVFRAVLEVSWERLETALKSP